MVCAPSNPEQAPFRLRPAGSPTKSITGRRNPSSLFGEALQRFHYYYGDDFKVECPTGSGHFLTLREVAEELARRLSRLFLKGPDVERPVLKYHPKLAADPHFRDYVLFHEYFHGDTGRGAGASHQTGWTGLVAKLLQPSNRDPHAARGSRRCCPGGGFQSPTGGAVIGDEVAAPPLPGLSQWRSYLELTKPKVVTLITFTSLVGTLLASSAQRKRTSPHQARPGTRAEHASRHPLDPAARHRA